MTHKDVQPVNYQPLQGLGTTDKIKRRLTQVFHMMSSRNFGNPSSAVRSLYSRYRDENELKYYRQAALEGLFDTEKEALEFLFESSLPKSALVIGCGAGREVFPLAEMGIETLGIDMVPEMIELANSIAQKNQSPAKFSVGSIHTLNADHQFDLIFLTPGLTGHLPTVASRIDFLHELKNFLSPSGKILATPDIVPFSKFSKQSLGSALLKIKWRKIPGAWSKGDTLRAFWGHHNPNDSLYYFHFYQSEAEVASEAQLAGFRVLKKIHDIFILEDVEA